MSDSTSSYTRRNVLRGALFTAAAVPFGLTLASCATGGGTGEETGDDPTDEGPVDSENPFGIEDGATVDAVIFNGGYGVDYVEFAANLFNEMYGGDAVVSPSTEISSELQPRFVGGNPPDLIDNSGAQSIGFNSILDQLEDLEDVLDAPSLEGPTIRETLVGEAILDSGRYDGSLKAINYVLTMYGVWYSASLFEANGWTAPTTWDEAFELGAAAQEQGKFLFLFGKEAATYYQTLALDSAIKQGGDEVRLPLENLEPDAYSNPVLQEVFEQFKRIIDAGYMKPGGSGTQFTAAQSQWSLDQAALLYPSGSWIENEMKDNTAEDFQMTGINTPTLDASPALPMAALHAEAGEPFIVPSQGANVAGGKELLRIMLSKEAASNFSKTKLAPTVIKDTVPEDGFGSTALLSQSEILAAAGSDTFTYKFNGLYGLNTEQLVVWNSFLEGDLPVADLTSGLQSIADNARETQEVIPVTE
jgi:N-acetylglucosamine transport system substrate-binding protein